MKRILIWLLDKYKKYLSPLLPAACRFYPTCSEYAKEAIIRFGVFKGIFLAVRRLLHCCPLYKGGYDPVPDDEKDIFPSPYKRVSKSR